MIHAWYPGQSGGKALADILFGKVSPSGKLPVTFYESADALPAFEDYTMAGRTYRYTRENILYPFGYGLTYSKTACSDLAVEGRKVKVTITNTGKTDTDDVVQFYIKDDSACAVPYPSLCGFERVHLAAGEKKTVETEIPEIAFTSVDENGVRAVRGKNSVLYAGTCQPDPLSEQLTGTACLSKAITL